MKTLYEKYKKLNIQNQYTLAEVDNIFKKKYRALEVDIKDYDFLKLEFNYKKIQSYKFENKEILNSLFTDQEKKDLIEIKVENQKYQINSNDKADIENTKIQEGEYLLAFLGSNDGKYIDDFSLLGYSQMLFDRLLVLKGLPKDDCKLGNIDFEHYLESLSNLGYIK